MSSKIHTEQRGDAWHAWHAWHAWLSWPVPELAPKAQGWTEKEALKNPAKHRISRW